jgi:hypothetical protein
LREAEGQLYLRFDLATAQAVVPDPRSLLVQRREAPADYVSTFLQDKSHHDGTTPEYKESLSRTSTEGGGAR